MKKLKRLISLVAALCIFGVSAFTNPGAFQANAEGETIYRIHNPRNGEYLLTSSTGERDNLVASGWTDDGVSWGVGSEVPVYRVFSSVEHLFTTSEAERDFLIANGWADEGVAFYTPASSDAPVYRLYNSSTGKHYYTTNGGEKDELVAKGWTFDCVAWYVYDASAVASTSTYTPVDTTTVSMPNPPFFSQKDGTWAYNTYGGYSLASTGCGVCVLSMIMSVRTGRTVYPYEMAENLYNAGYYNNIAWKGEAGTYASSCEAASSIYGVACYGIAMNDITGVTNALASGQMLYVSVAQYPFVTGGYTHSILLFGYEDGRTSVYDPLDGRTNGVWDISYIMDRLSYSAVDTDTGTGIYAF